MFTLCLPTVLFDEYLYPANISKRVIMVYYREQTTTPETLCSTPCEWCVAELINSVCGFFNVPQSTWSTLKGCETGPAVYRRYPRRIERLTICRCHYKGSTCSSVIKDPECWSGRGLEPATFRTETRCSNNLANLSAVRSFES